MSKISDPKATPRRPTVPRELVEHVRKNSDAGPKPVSRRTLALVKRLQAKLPRTK